MRRVTQPVVDALSAQARARPVRHGDETGGREAAQHGDVWSLSTVARTGCAPMTRTAVVPAPWRHGGWAPRQRLLWWLYPPAHSPSALLGASAA